MRHKPAHCSLPQPRQVGYGEHFLCLLHGHASPKPHPRARFTDKPSTRERTHPWISSSFFFSKWIAITIPASSCWKSRVSATFCEAFSVVSYGAVDAFWRESADGE